MGSIDELSDMTGLAQKVLLNHWDIFSRPLRGLVESRYDRYRRRQHNAN